MSLDRASLSAQVAAEWEELLLITPSDQSDFFEDGGHSLLAARLAAAVSARLGITVGIEIVFEYPTLKAFVDTLRVLCESET
jgi:acyl carrier protein